MSTPRGPLSSTTPPESIIVGGVYNAVAPAPADQQPCALQLDSEGNVLVNVNAGTVTTTNASVGATGVAAPTSATEEGFVANVGTALPTAVTNGQLVGGMADKFGREVVLLNGHRQLIGTAVVSNNSTSSGVSFIAAGATGVFNDIITFIATNRSSTATVITLTDGTASYTFAIAGNGGIVINFPTPLPATSSATAWTIGNSATVACDYIAVYAKNK